VGRKVLLLAMLLLTVAGLGVSAYLVMSTGTIKVDKDRIELRPSSYELKTDYITNSSIYTQNVTLNTTSKSNIDLEIRVLPGDERTAEAWGKEFFAYAEPSIIENIKKGKDKNVTIIHWCDDSAKGEYKVRVIAVVIG